MKGQCRAGLVTIRDGGTRRRPRVGAAAVAGDIVHTAAVETMALPGPGPAVTLSPAYDRALCFARVLHARQYRKYNGAPYLSHLLEVSGLVLQHGGDEIQAVAALLHDAIEDQSAAFGGAARLRLAIRTRFGDAVLRLVELCSDCDSTPKPAWLARKREHLARLSAASAYDCLVPTCDKLHNLRCINSELRAGHDTFGMLNAGAAEQIWNFSALTVVFERKQLPLARDLHFELSQLRRFAADRCGAVEPHHARECYAMP